jgi:hypothetical protein
MPRFSATSFAPGGVPNHEMPTQATAYTTSAGRCVHDAASVALAARMPAQRLLQMIAHHTKLCVAFGKPIGSYHGVEHKCSGIENAK